MGSILSQNVVTGELLGRGRIIAEATDQQLVSSVAKGDEAAFVELYSRYKVTLFNYLLRLISEQNIAEDLLQEVFVAVWKGAGKFKAQSSVRTWLFRIAHNQAVSWLRRRKDVVDDDEMLHLIADGDVLEETVLESWHADQLRDALGQLTPAHRAVVELSFVHELTYAEIGEIMDCPVGTIKSRMSYALKYLDGFLRRNGVGA